MSDKIISESDLRNENPIVLPESTKSFSRYTFWHYTKLSTVESILENRCFHVSSFANMNDLDEADLHWKNRGDVFALCFCNSNTEKIPMWYLYSGIDGNGAALGLTPAAMLSFLSSIDSATIIEGKQEGKKLKRGIDFDVQCGWVYYNVSSEPDRYYYRNRWYKVDNPFLFNRNNYFLKRYPWEYEQEFRIVFINKQKELFKKISVTIPDETLSSFKLMLAPEINRRSVEEKIACYPAIQDLLYRRIERSKLSINMNLLERNKTAIWDYVQAEARKCGEGKNVEELVSRITKTN